MRVEPSATDVLTAKLRSPESRHALLLARPTTAASADAFRVTLIQYFVEKQAAGIIRVGQGAILYLFPPSSAFVDEHLAVRQTAARRGARSAWG